MGNVHVLIDIEGTYSGKLLCLGDAVMGEVGAFAIEFEIVILGVLISFGFEFWESGFGVFEFLLEGSDFCFIAGLADISLDAFGGFFAEGDLVFD